MYITPMEVVEDAAADSVTMYVGDTVTTLVLQRGVHVGQRGEVLR